MNRTTAALLTAAAVVLAAPTLYSRWKIESQENRLLILVDWPEARDLSARQAKSDVEILAALHAHGANGAVTAALTLGEAAGRYGAAKSGDPLSGKSLSLPPTLAKQAFAELTRRGAGDLSLVGQTLRRQKRSFDDLRDIEIGFDPTWLSLAETAGISVICRINRDPWMPWAAMRNALQQGSFDRCDGVIFNADEIPGGSEALGFWKSWLERRGVRNLLFEFRPTKSAWLLSQAAPRVTFRAHTISATEVKDLSSDQERSRWHRAVEERSCRFLLVHPALNEGFGDLIARLDRLVADSAAWKWKNQIPGIHWTWSSNHSLLTKARTWTASLVAALTPVLALWLAWGLLQTSRVRPSSTLTTLTSFLLIGLIAMIGGSVAAALAQSPETQLQILPFRATKAAFVISWVGSIFILYKRTETVEFLKQPLRRLDLLFGIAIVALVGYVLIRSGNAPSAWKPPFEQLLRDRLEDWLQVRPRFKEFAVGHPLLLLGFWLAPWFRSRLLDVRVLVALGMVAPISIVNTFCHLHSPLALAYGRSLMGMALGLVIGAALIGTVKWRDVQKS